LHPVAASSLALPLRLALRQLAKARDYARDVACDPWEFAVEIERLIRLGVTTSDLRWLAKKGLIEHATEATKPSDPARQFERRKNLAFTSASCFCLVDAVSIAPEDEPCSPHQDDPALPEDVPPAAATPVAATPVAAMSVPRWDVDDRTLYVGDRVVKEYRVRSPNQEAVLSAFEEEGWPHYVDDPLSPAAEQSPKQRLRDTIKCLNTNQKNRLLRFRGDGTGERVRWEFRDP
jgi:hypothetical protein